MNVYKITNTVNGMSYIGATVSPINERFARHKYDAFTRNHQHPFAQALREYGTLNFSIQLIDTALTRNELFAKEQAAIRDHQTLWPHGYNMTIGGLGTQGYEWPEEYLEKRPRHVHSPEQRAKWSAMRKGQRLPEHVKRKLSDSLKGRPGRTLTEQEKEKLRTMNLGRKASPETRARMSAAHKARYAKGKTP